MCFRETCVKKKSRIGQVPSPCRQTIDVLLKPRERQPCSLDHRSTSWLSAWHVVRGLAVSFLLMRTDVVFISALGVALNVF